MCTPWSCIHHLHVSGRDGNIWLWPTCGAVKTPVVLLHPRRGWNECKPSIWQRRSPRQPWKECQQSGSTKSFFKLFVSFYSLWGLWSLSTVVYLSCLFMRTVVKSTCPSVVFPLKSIQDPLCQISHGSLPSWPCICYSGAGVDMELLKGSVQGVVRNNQQGGLH